MALQYGNTMTDIKHATKANNTCGDINMYSPPYGKDFIEHQTRI